MEVTVTMRLRPYISSRDFEYLRKWGTDERAHALWCANLIPYPFSEEELNDVLKKNEHEWGASAYIVTEDNGQPVGFFTYSVNVNDNSGFFTFIVVDSELRGKGYGTEIMELALNYAYLITGVTSVQLNVFDVNKSAIKCYLKAGFIERNTVSNAFTYKNESWSRCNMVARR